MSYNTKKEQTIQHSTIPHCANGATHSTFNIPHSTLRLRRSPLPPKRGGKRGEPLRYAIFGWKQRREPTLALVVEGPEAVYEQTRPAPAPLFE